MDSPAEQPRETRERQLSHRPLVLALIDIYSRFGVFIGGRLSFDDLLVEWRKSGFRGADLEIAIDEAIEHGLVELDPNTTAPTVALLSSRVPAPEDERLTKRIQTMAQDRTLQLQRARSTARTGKHPWDGIDRRNR